MEVDHYQVLGLLSGPESQSLTEKEISKAYRKKALELHPDKHPNDPNAPSRFQKLQFSYEILKDPVAKKEFDHLLTLRREKEVRNSHYDSKRRRMVSDLEEREKAAAAGGGPTVVSDPEKKARDEEERIKRKLAEEIARIREMMEKKNNVPTTSFKEKEDTASFKVELDKSKVLKVSWEKSVSEYSAKRLKEIFEEFGEVEDVVIKSSKKKGSALVVMASKDDVVAATGVMVGDLSNPLLVLPLEQGKAMPSVRAQGPVGRDEDASLGNVVGAGFQAFENSVLDKLKKAAQRQKEGKQET